MRRIVLVGWIDVILKVSLMFYSFSVDRLWISVNKMYDLEVIRDIRFL